MNLTVTTGSIKLLLLIADNGTFKYRDTRSRSLLAADIGRPVLVVCSEAEGRAEVLGASGGCSASPSWPRASSGCTLQPLPSSTWSELNNLCRHQHAQIASHGLLVAWVYLFLWTCQDQESPELVSSWQTFTRYFSARHFSFFSLLFSGHCFCVHTQRPHRAHPHQLTREGCSWHPVMMLKPSPESLLPRPLACNYGLSTPFGIWTFQCAKTFLYSTFPKLFRWSCIHNLSLSQFTSSPDISISEQSFI